MDNLINKFEEIIRWPKKSSDKEIVIQYLAAKFSALTLFTKIKIQKHNKVLESNFINFYWFG